MMPLSCMACVSAVSNVKETRLFVCVLSCALLKMHFLCVMAYCLFVILFLNDNVFKKIGDTAKILSLSFTYKSLFC